MLHRIAFAIAGLILLSTYSDGQHTLILRSLRQVHSPAIEFDEYQITTSDGQIFTWDQIFSATVAVEQQKKFDELLQEVGIPLYRIRHRMRNGDFESLGKITELLGKKFDDGPVTAKNCRTRFILHLGRFCHRIGATQHEQATFQLIELSKLMSSFGDELESVELPKGLTIGEIEQSFSSILLPIWFDQSRALVAWKRIQSFHKDELDQLSDGGLIYAASLAIASKQPFAKIALGELDSRSSTIVNLWLPILLAYEEVTNGRSGRNISKLQNEVTNLRGAERAVAQYLVGYAAGSLNGRFDDGILQLLYIPAVHGERFRHLSAAALFSASELARQAGNLPESESLKTELKNRFPNSYHAKLLQSK